MRGWCGLGKKWDYLARCEQARDSEILRQIYLRVDSLAKIKNKKMLRRKMINTKHYRGAHPHVPSHTRRDPISCEGGISFDENCLFRLRLKGTWGEKIDSASGSDKSWRHERWMELQKSWDENNGKSASTSIHFNSMIVLHASSIPHLAISSSNLIHFLCSLAPFFHPRFTRCRMKANWIVFVQHLESCEET